MPTYDYRCEACGPFEAMRRMAERDAPLHCPACGAIAARAWLAAARHVDLPESTRGAIEGARREPERSSGYARLRHPGGCACCSRAGRGRG